MYITVNYQLDNTLFVSEFNTFQVQSVVVCDPS